MGWIDIAWPMIGATSLTLGLIYLLVWVRQPTHYGYLLFFLTAASAAVFSIFELRMMRAATPEEYAVTLRWAHLPLFTLFVSVVGFVHFYLRSGRMWLGSAACGLRAVVLVLNFRTGVNVNFDQVTAMLPVRLWGGESIYLPVGVPNPYVIVAQLSNLLLIWFVADASVALWRRGDASARRRAARGRHHVPQPPRYGRPCRPAQPRLGPDTHGRSRSPFSAWWSRMAYELGWDVIAAARLTTRLRLSDERLRESEQRLQLAAGAGELGLWEWNVAIDEVWMTPECRALFGYRADEPVGLGRFLESVHPDDRAVVESNVSASLSQRGREFEQDFRIVLPDGHVRWVTSRGRIERDAKGTACRMRGVTHDVTARRLAEERFRTLVEAAPTAMLMVDDQGNIVLLNARAGTMFGYAREELVGRSIESLVPARYRISHESHRQAYREDSRARAMGAGRELFATRKDGTELPVEVGLNPMQTSEGSFVIASVVDVSERKRA